MYDNMHVGVVVPCPAELRLGWHRDRVTVKRAVSSVFGRGHVVLIRHGNGTTIAGFYTTDGVLVVSEADYTAAGAMRKLDSRLAEPDCI